MDGEWTQGQRRNVSRPGRCGFGFAAQLRALCLTLLTAAAPTHAGELVDLDVHENGGTYHIHADMVIHADSAHVRAVLTDYAHVYRFNPAIVESEILPAPTEAAVRVRTQIEECLAFYCVDLVSVADVSVAPSGDLHAVIIPELSSFRSGTAEWRIRADHGVSRVVYDATMVPDFFVPPVFGPHIMIRKLANETMKTFSRLECIARIRARREAGDQARDASLQGGPECGDDG